MFKICLYVLLIHANAVTKENCCVQGGNKEFCSLIHKDDFILLYENSERVSTYVDIIFL